MKDLNIALDFLSKFHFTYHTSDQMTAMVSDLIRQKSTQKSHTYEYRCDMKADDLPLILVV